MTAWTGPRSGAGRFRVEGRGGSAWVRIMRMVRASDRIRGRSGGWTSHRAALFEWRRSRPP